MTEVQQGVEARIVFLGPIRSIVGKKEQRMLLQEGATFRDLLDELSRTNTSEFTRYIVIEGKTLNPALLVILNGQSVDEIQNLDAPLAVGSTVHVLLTSPLAGGASA